MGSSQTGMCIPRALARSVVLQNCSLRIRDATHFRRCTGSRFPGFQVLSSKFRVLSSAPRSGLIHVPSASKFARRLRRAKLGTWNLELGTWNLELGTWNLELGTRNSELGTRNLEFRSTLSASDAIFCTARPSCGKPKRRPAAAVQSLAAHTLADRKRITIRMLNTTFIPHRFARGFGLSPPPHGNTVIRLPR